MRSPDYHPFNVFQWLVVVPCMFATLGTIRHHFVEAFMCLQVDLDMLNVSLGTGTLEVRSALLNTGYLDAQLVRPLAHAPFSRSASP